MRVGAVLLLLIGVNVVSWAQTDSCEKRWREVEESVGKGLPKRAVEQLISLERQAVTDREWDHALKAVARRLDLEMQANGNKPEALLASLRETAGRAPDPMKPFLELLVAHHTWRYYIINRERFSQRPQGASMPSGVAMDSWSLPRLLDEIETSFCRALAFAPVLKKIPVREYGELLEPGTVPDAYRPTLYDFIVYEMIDFYALGEQVCPTWDGYFELSADGPALDDVPGFSFIIPDEAAARSHVLRALRLFQNLLTFHEKDEDPAAYADADLSRLLFCRNQVVGENRDLRYSAALDRFSHKWKRHEISSRADVLRARLALERGNPGLARMIAQNGAVTYPESIGAAQCRNLIDEIEKPSASFTCERVWCAPWPEMEITYKNLTQIQFRAVPVTFEEMFSCRPVLGDLYRDTGIALLKRKPAKSWSVSLPPTADYKEHVYRLTVPKDLRPGLYAVISSSDGIFVEKGSPVAWELFRVSGLAMVLEQNQGRVNGYVLTARDGEPVAGARVGVWREDRKNKFKREQTILTGEDGSFSVLGEQSGELLLYAEKNGEAAQTWQPIWKGDVRERNRASDVRVVFFTDRAVYRPGQTLRYKGVSFVADPQDGVYHTVDGKTFSVNCTDAKGKVIAVHEVTGNDYGSFSGSFTVPVDYGVGPLSIRVEGLGQCTVRVDDCKPPAFDVMLTPTEACMRVGTVVSVFGLARSPSGVPVKGSPVVWRVARGPARGDGHGAAERAVQEIARGETFCDEDGAFAISFFADPGEKMSEKLETAFSFTVTADVTDTSGDTRSGACRLVVGDTAWQATVTCDAWQTVQEPVAMNVRVQTYNGASVAAEGVLTVFSVRQPERVLRPRLGASPIFGACSGRSEEDRADPENWPEERELSVQPMVTGTNGLAMCSVPLKAGTYRVRFETRDPDGRAVTAGQTVHVIDLAMKRLNIKVADYFVAESWRVEPGGTFRAAWGSGYESGTVLVIVEQNGRELLRQRSAPGLTQHRIDLPITEAMRGGVWVRTLFMRENRMYGCRHAVDVPWSNKRLSLTLKQVNTKREAGEAETWQAVIRDGNGDLAAAEVVATLYEDALDGSVRPGWLQSFDRYFKRCDPGGEFVFENRLTPRSCLFVSGSRLDEAAVWRYRTWCGRVGTGESKGALERSKRTGCDHAVSDRTGSARNTKCSPSGSGINNVGGDTWGTAFFLPHLVSDENGGAAIPVTGPAAAKGWRLMVFAHDKALRGGYLEAGFMDSPASQEVPVRFDDEPIGR